MDVDRRRRTAARTPALPPLDHRARRRLADHRPRPTAGRSPASRTARRLPRQRHLHRHGHRVLGRRVHDGAAPDGLPVRRRRRRRHHPAGGRVPDSREGHLHDQHARARLHRQPRRVRLRRPVRARRRDRPRRRDQRAVGDGVRRQHDGQDPGCRSPSPGPTTWSRAPTAASSTRPWSPPVTIRAQAPFDLSSRSFPDQTGPRYSVLGYIGTKGVRGRVKLAIKPQRGGRWRSLG